MADQQYLDKPARTAQALGASEHINAANLLLTDSGVTASSWKTRPPSSSEPVATPTSSADNSIPHLAVVAVKSLWHGFTEPVIGTAQLAEQGANALGLKDQTGASYFSPEKLSPDKSPEPTTYSAEWFIKTGCETAGKLPWYLLASRVMRSPQAILEETLAAQKLPALGMSTRTAMYSGFALGALSPTAVTGNTGLVDSLKERLIQGSVGAGQMALMSLGTETTAGLFARTENRLLKKSSLDAPFEPPALSTTVARKTLDWSLNFVKKGTIASVGSVPGGLTAGYADSAIHGEKFDARKNLVSTLTMGFGLGGFSRSPQTHFDLTKSIESPAPSDTTSGTTAEQPVVRVENYPNGRTVEYHTYTDGTVVENHMPSSMPGMGNSKYTKYPDGRTILEYRDGKYSEFPDGSWERVDSYSTMHSENGETQNKWATASIKWFKLSPEEKLSAVSDLDQVPKGGNLVGELLERALFSDSIPDVHLKAISQIKNIGDSGVQAEIWNRAWGNYPEYRSQLLESWPTLSSAAQARTMYTYSNHFDEADNRRLTASKIGEVLEAMKSRTTGSSDDDVISNYLKTTAALPESSRRAIFAALDPLLRNPDQSTGTPLIDELAKRISNGLSSSDALVGKAFNDFWDKPASKTLASLPETKVDRSDLPQVTEDPATIQARLEKFKQIFTCPDNWEKQAVQFLSENPQVSTLKAIEDWSANQPDKAIQRLVGSTVNFESLRQTYVQLTKDMELKSEAAAEARFAPQALLERAARDGVSPERVNRTLQNVVQLLEIGDQFKDFTAAKEFKVAAVQALRQAADPLIITQGAHPTCALASLEMSVYTHTPDSATRLVSEILRTGKFVTTNGTTISIDTLSLKPEARGLEANKTKYIASADAGQYRSYASQVFQTTVGNIFWQQRLTSPYNKNFNPKVEKNSAIGLFSFETRTEYDTKGKPTCKDQVVDYHTGVRREWSQGPSVTSLDMLQFMGYQIEPAAKPTVLLGNAPEISSRQAFTTYLNGLKDNQFPVIIGIDAKRIGDMNNPDFGLNHAVSVLKSPDGKYLVHNTWQPYSDIHAPGGWIQNSFTLDHLMSMMGVPEP
jgi:hypothetical protein